MRGQKPETRPASRDRSRRNRLARSPTRPEPTPNHLSAIKVTINVCHPSAGRSSPAGLGHAPHSPASRRAVREQYTRTWLPSDGTRHRGSAVPDGDECCRLSPRRSRTHPWSWKKLVVLIRKANSPRRREKFYDDHGTLQKMLCSTRSATSASAITLCADRWPRTPKTGPRDVTKSGATFHPAMQASPEPASLFCRA